MASARLVQGSAATTTTTKAERLFDDEYDDAIA
jgi:hypothetical protein